jgi:hypothetical protein
MKLSYTALSLIALLPIACSTPGRVRVNGIDAITPGALGGKGGMIVKSTDGQGGTTMIATVYDNTDSFRNAVQAGVAYAGVGAMESGFNTAVDAWETADTATTAAGVSKAALSTEAQKASISAGVQRAAIAAGQ